MKIIILSILLTTQAQYIDDQSNTFTTNDGASTMNYFTLLTQTVNEQIKQEDRTLFLESSTENNLGNETSTLTILTNLFDVTKSTEENETGLSSFSPSSEYEIDYTTLTNQVFFRKEQWFNVNQSDKGESYNSSLSWKKINDDSLDGSTYIIKSEGQCLRERCYIKLKYNGSLSNNLDGCLSFVLWTRGQPVGQLWIEEDEEQESFSQKIQLTNSSLRVEHSLRSRTKNLSIDARILFRNSQIDSITLSNLNVNWKGPCPQHRSIVTTLPYQSTSEDDLITFTSELSTLITHDRFESSEEVQSSTIKLNAKEVIQRPSSFMNQNNIGWILTLIILFCLLIILSSLIYGLWSIQRHYRSTWYVRFDSPIQFLARRSIRSSTRSENKIGTLSQISRDLRMDSQIEYFDSFSSSSGQSTPSPFHAYF